MRTKIISRTADDITFQLFPSNTAINAGLLVYEHYIPGTLNEDKNEALFINLVTRYDKPRQ